MIFSDLDQVSEWQVSCNQTRGGAFMSRKMQLSPQASTSIPRRNIAALNSTQNSWSAAPSPSHNLSLDSPLDIGILRSWFDGDLDPGQSSLRPDNWGAISGLALAATVSASCWAGVVWIVTRVWR
jgi:hypothetical protein